MRELEDRIMKWRQGLIAAGIKSSASLDELEEHLRDDIDQQVMGGVAAEPAFENAVCRLGGATEIKKEFEKHQSNRKDMKQTTIHFIAIFATIAIGAAFFMPGMAKWLQDGVFDTLSLSTFILGILILGWGVMCGVGEIRKLMKRRRKA